MVQAKQILQDSKKQKEKELEEKLIQLKEKQKEKENVEQEIFSASNRRGKRTGTNKADSSVRLTTKRANDLNLKQGIEYFNQKYLSSNYL